MLAEPIPPTLAGVQRFRRRLKKLAARLPLRPLIRFLYSYIFRLGFLDGRPGLIFCGLLAFYDFLILANRYEHQWKSQAAGLGARPSQDNDDRGPAGCSRTPRGERAEPGIPQLAGSPR